MINFPEAEEFLGYFSEKIKIGDALIIHHDNTFFQNNLQKCYECSFNDIIFGISNGQNYFLTEETYNSFAFFCYDFMKIDMPDFQVIKTIGKQIGMSFEKNENELDGIIIMHTFFDFHPYFINLKLRNQFINLN